MNQAQAVVGISFALEGRLLEATAFLVAYLVGSIPWGLVLTGAAGLGDIRRLGSGNIGATNVLRTGRRGLAAATLLLDAAKGAVAVALARAVVGPEAAAVAALAAVLGHCFPPWLAFRGGKGVATALGALLVLDWPAGLCACAAWAAVAAALRISSAAALAAMLAAAVLGCLTMAWPLLLAPVLVALLVAARHHGNIRRLLAGTEPRIGRGA